MNLDSALNLKAEILTRGLGLHSVPYAASLEPGDRVDNQARFSGAELESDQRADVLPRLASRIAVGVAIVGQRTDQPMYGVTVYYQDRRLRGHEIFDRVRRLAAGEVTLRFVGRVRKALGFKPADTHRPLRIGASISHCRATSGTLSCFVKIGGSEAPCILSNNHVIAGVDGAPGDVVIQPGRADGGRADLHCVGHLQTKIPLHIGGGGINAVDCAVARALPGMLPTANGLGALPPGDRAAAPGRSPPVRLQAPIGVAAAIGQPVWKFGCTSGWTEGVVSAVEVTGLTVAMSSQGVRQIARFDGQMAIEGQAGHGAFAKPGDSGALVLKSDGAPIGLVFAVADAGGENGGRLAFANPMTEVLLRLDAALCV